MTEPVYATDRVQLYAGDCLDVLPTLGDATVDAVVTDPPYGLSREPDMREVLRHWLAGDDYQHRGGGFMGKTWDAFVPGPATWRECYRVMKPGAHLLAFGGTRTWDMLMLAIRLAGFEVRDTIADLTGRHAAALLWVQGAGFPKSLDVGKAIDKAAGAEREVVGPRVRVDGKAPGKAAGIWSTEGALPTVVTAPATDEAKRWHGFGTSLKPAHEPVVVARKPLAGTVAQNVLAYGTGGINVDGCRVGDDTSRGDRYNGKPSKGGGDIAIAGTRDEVWDVKPGRWPANVLLSGDAAEEMDRQSGTLTSGKMKPTHTTAGVDGRASAYGKDAAEGFTTMETYGDTGGASRFFPVFRYQPKADRDERVEVMTESGERVAHPT